jgi:hypothetical protein
MGWWNYRVLRRVYGEGKDAEESFGIHEVYYDKDGSAEMCSVDPIDAHGSTPEELKADLENQLKAFNQPVLEWNDFNKRGTSK